MSKYDELKAAAEAATKGDWSVDRLAVTADTRSLVCCGQAYLECCGNPDVDGDEYDPICSATSESDAAYIAAANPVAILEMIAENERLRDAMAGLLEWVAPIAGDNQDDEASQRELDSVRAAEAVMQEASK